jgi:pyruvate dehydrogenase E2 component (dihydrolipoamide acetyltransferase)
MTDVPLTRIQKLIGERMLASKRTKPCFYLERKVDVTELMRRRHKLSKALGVKITSNTFLIRALALAARQFPLMLGRLVGAPSQAAIVRIAEAVNVGFAVNSPQGLVVPVIQEADRKALAEVAVQERLLTQKARSNRLALADIEGESVALSNLGAYDVDTFIGIVPPATSTILAVGNIVRSVVPVDSRLDVRKTVSVSIAVDHRIAGPEYAARFLSRIAELLVEPEQLI